MSRPKSYVRRAKSRLRLAAAGRPFVILSEAKNLAVPAVGRSRFFGPASGASE